LGAWLWKSTRCFECCVNYDSGFGFLIHGFPVAFSEASSVTSPQRHSFRGALCVGDSCESHEHDSCVPPTPSRQRSTQFMLLVIKWLVAPVVVLGMMSVMDTKQAQAQFGIGIGFQSGRGISIGIGNRYPTYRSYYVPSYRWPSGYRYVTPYRSHHSGHSSHSRHLGDHHHYRPSQVIPHGHHLHVIPGHYGYYPGRNLGHGHCRYSRHH